jgi:hypothetical protein
MEFLKAAFAAALEPKIGLGIALGVALLGWLAWRGWGRVYRKVEGHAGRAKSRLAEIFKVAIDSVVAAIFVSVATYLGVIDLAGATVAYLLLLLLQYGTRALGS